MSDLPSFQKGARLLASQLNQIVNAVVSRINAGTGIEIRRSGNQVTVSTVPNNPIPATSTVIANITGENGSGVYTWERYKGPGPESGEATELNLSTGILTNTKVILHRGSGSWWFFFPVEEC